MKISILILILAFIITLIYQSIVNKKERDAANKATLLLYNKKFDEFDEFMNTKEARKSIRRFNYCFLRLNEAIYKNNDKEIALIYKEFDDIHMNNQQAITLYTNLFTYFIETKNESKAKEVYSKIKKIKNVSNIYSIDRLYNIHIDKGYKYLDDTIKELNNADDINKPILESLISIMYENKGDTENAKKYNDLLLSHLSNYSKNK